MFIAKLAEAFVISFEEPTGTTIFLGYAPVLFGKNMIFFPFLFSFLPLLPLLILSLKFSYKSV